MNNTSKMWAGLVLLAVLVVGSVFFMRTRTAQAPTTNTVSSASEASTTTSLGNGVSVVAPAGTTIAVSPSGNKAPSLTGPILISASLPQDAQTILKNKEVTLIAQLQKNPTNIDLWLDLGIDRKIGGDYAGAAEAWGYVAKAAPASASFVAYGNLGSLYMDYLKDYPKAEANFKQAVLLSPHTIDYYRELYTLYKYSYKTNTTAAADILAQGLKANPGNADLLVLQQQS
ncbi:MAG: tetratricopeptide repeat protein [bacterium]